MLVLAAILGAIAVGAGTVVRTLLLKRPPEGLLALNFRGSRVPLAGGPAILGSLLISEAVFGAVTLVSPIGLDGVSGPLSPSAIPRTFLSFDHLGLLVLIFGFFALGSVDDLSGMEHARGLKGHLQALRRGTLTGGSIKAFGGAALAFAVGATWELTLPEALLDAAVIALSANLINLFDLRPGRASKVFLIAWASLAGSAWATPFFPVSAMVAGGVVAWLPADLREQGMLGDSGANLMGVTIGAGLVLTLGTPGKLTALVVTAALTLISERWSFGEIIDRTAPLRWSDRLGRLP